MSSEAAPFGTALSSARFSAAVDTICGVGAIPSFGFDKPGADRASQTIQRWTHSLPTDVQDVGVEVWSISVAVDALDLE